MKILFTGGETGGHFYPIIAIAEELNALAEKNHLIQPQMYFLAPDPYDKDLLFENNIEFRKSPAGKMRRYFSLLNVLDIFKVGIGIIRSLWQLYKIFPDVVFGKGGYGSFPTLFAARILGIPVVIHESDSVPGRTNAWAGKFAKSIAVSYADAATSFPESKVALTGNPIRKQMLTPQKSGAYEFLKLEEGVPVVFVLCGSQGAQKVNDAILSILPELLEKYQVIHQTGDANFKDVEQTASVILKDSSNQDRYRPFPYLNTLALKMAAGISDLMVTRGGSTLFEIAVWGIPSIVIPIEDTNGDHQRKNAFTYAQAGAAVVVEEKSLAPHVLLADIRRLMDTPADREAMAKAAKEFAKPDAARKIAEEILRIGLGHEE